MLIVVFTLPNTNFLTCINSSQVWISSKYQLGMN
jgi:hypothetical protein